jgi:hypothetical protein
MDDPFPKVPMNRRRTLEQRLEIARLAEGRAAERLARKTRKVQKYEAARKARERKLDTRRKIIAGALALEHIRHDPEFGVVFRELLDTYVIKEPERILFGLEPLPPERVEAMAAALAKKG